MDRLRPDTRPAPWPADWPARLGWLALAAYVIYAVARLDVNLPRIVSGLDNGARFIGRMLPPHIALQNPELIGGHSFYAFPELDAVLVMIDRNGDENYQPMLIPLDGGFPEPSFDNFFENYRVHLGECDRAKGIVYLAAERRDKAWNELYRGNLKTGELTLIAESEFGFGVADYSRDHSKLLLGTGYSVGDGVLCFWNKGEMKTL